MKEEQEILKHVCKFCSKSFSCGRSLGGHMRSHMINDISALADGTKLTKKKLPSLPTINNNNGANNYSIDNTAASASGYGLRDNPKKNWRLADHSSEDNNNNNTCSSLVDKSCKECGKIFPSWKALFGHMKCHSLEKNNNFSVEVEEEEEEVQQQQDSSNSAYNNNQTQLLLDSQSDNETNAAAPNRRKRSKRRTIRYMGTTANSSSFNNNNYYYASSSVSETEQEQEEVAMCLMMLSRDVSQWGGFNSVSANSSDNNSVFRDETTNNLVSSSVAETGKLESSRKAEYSVSGISKKVFMKSEKEKNKTILDYDHESEIELGKNMLIKETEMISKKRKLADSFDPELSLKDSSRFECTTCNKVFHSYQALGGHRASHKKTKGCFASKIDSTENSIETEQQQQQQQQQQPETSTNKLSIDHHHNHHQTAETSYGAKKSKGHECPICLKVFPSGQALGGHKRSHLVGSTEPKNNHNTISIQPIREFLDLNLPAPVEEESSNNGIVGFNSWWVGRSSHNKHEHEQHPLVGLISN